VLSKEDRRQLREMGIDEKEIERQLECFRRGVRHIPLVRPCTANDGIVQLNHDQEPELIQAYSRAADAGRLSAFVPASGAASRMFRDLLALRAAYPTLSNGTLDERARANDSAAIFGLRFFRNITRFAFYPELRMLMKQDGLSIESLLETGEVSAILDYLLTDKGLGLAGLPKGLIPFHRYDGRSHTAFEEQVYEAVELISDREGVVRIHFTVPPGAEPGIAQTLNSLVEQEFGEDFEVQIEFSIQQSSTDTIAVTKENEPFRDDHGRLVFRPGGHGALLKNLNELDADIVLIKNIDNVTPHVTSQDRYFRRKVLTGYLVRIQAAVHAALRELEGEIPEKERIEEIRLLATESLGHPLPEGWYHWALKKRAEWLQEKLDRPLRVCGMVPNTGEPGGGPFHVVLPSGEIAPQIVESSQIDLGNPEQRRIFEASTHFNPVDLVCGLRNHHGEKHNLMQFSDPEAVFISDKTFQGQPLKALELPGLWNGGMAGWNTILVEIPQQSFTPVKTVNDLLRDEHRVEKQGNTNGL